MAESSEVFQRYEKKYLLDTPQYQAITELLAGRVVLSEFGSSTIGNLYFDTPDYRLIRASIEKPVYKEKLRLRSYGLPKKDDKVFLELKKKYQGQVYKRRVALTLRESEQYLLHGTPLLNDSQIIKEIDWFLNFYRPIPRVYIAYERTALRGRDNADLRLTFDSNLRWRQSMLDLAKGSWGNPLLPKGQYLLEIKTPGAMPLWLSQILTQLKIFPTSFSKYGNCYKEHLRYSAELGGIYSA